MLPTALVRLTRYPSRLGRLATVAVYILTEQQYSAGDRAFGGFLVSMNPGESLITYSAVAKVIQGKTTTAKRMVEEVAAEAGWTLEAVTTNHRRVRRRTEGVTPGIGVGDNRGGYIGVLISTSKIKGIAEIGAQAWGGKGGHPLGPPRGGLPKKRDQPRKDQPKEKRTSPKPSFGFFRSDEGRSTLDGDSRAAAGRRLFVYWCEVHKKRSSTLYDDRRRRAVEGRLAEGRTEEDVQQAIRGVLLSDFHASGGHTDLELVCRDEPHLSRYMEFESNPPRPRGDNGSGRPLTPRQMKILDEDGRWIDGEGRYCLPPEDGKERR